MAETKTAPEKTKTDGRYKMPEVYVGEIVLWHAGMRGDPSANAPFPSLVTAVGDRTVSLTAFCNKMSNGFPKDGVRHWADPDTRRDDTQELGTWEETPQSMDQRKTTSHLLSLLK